MGSITVPVDSIVGVLAFVVQMACVLGALAFTHGRLDQRIKAVEGHADTVSRIAPLEAQFSEFKNGVENRLEGIERAVRESAAATQALALALARRTA